MRSRSDSIRSNHKHWYMLAIGGLSTAIYWLTAYPTITWWHGSAYSLAAGTLGIPFPPGSLLLTILGWLVTRLPLGMSQAFSLNLFSGLPAALTSVLVFDIARRMFFLLRGAKSSTDRYHRFAFVGITAACLAFGLNQTVWNYSVQFTPYILTALFTSLLLWVMFRWWQHANRPDSWRLLFLIALLLGLDFSVHRTNLLLLPGFLAWLLLRSPRILAQLRAWAAGLTGLLLGLTFHLLIMPLAARDPILNANNPSNWSRFWDYVSLKQYGGNWLVNLYPRKAPFWDVQLADYLNMVRANFASTDGPLGILGLLPLLLVLVGIAFLWQANRRLTLGLITLYILSSVGAIIYFNTPEDFSWPMDRHYLPSFVLMAVFMSLGAGWLVSASCNHWGRYRRAVWIGMPVLISLLPLSQGLRNYRQENRSHNYFAYDYAANVLKSLRADAILLVDGDTFWPLLYLQAIEKVRLDVTIISTSLLNTIWYVEQITTRDPDLPLTLSEADLTGFPILPWQDSTFTISVAGESSSFELAEGAVLPDSLSLRVEPQLAGRFLLAQDWILLRLLVHNEWRRPIYLTDPPDWLDRYARNEGLVERLLPQDRVELNRDILRRNLMVEYSYRGYADDLVPIDQFTRQVALDLYQSFLCLAREESNRGDLGECATTQRSLLQLIPPERVGVPEDLWQAVDEICQQRDES